MITDGWDFVGWAYGIAYGALALYAAALVRRVRRAGREGQAQ